MNFELAPKQKELVETAERLARRFAERAARYDREATFPVEDFADLREHRLLAMTVPTEWGGLGLGISNGDPLTLWLITKSIAKGDSSTGQCIQVHSNMVEMIAVLGTEEQKRRYLTPVVTEGAIVSAYASEPPMVMPSRKAVPQSSSARRVPGGYVINGQKYYATNAGVAKYALIGVVLEGARHATEGMILPIVDTSTPGLIIKPEWWSHATGMRATVSHLVEFKDFFVSDDEVLTNPGGGAVLHFQARLLPQFASNFLGCAEAAYEFALGYLRNRGKLADPYVQHYIAEMRMAIQTATLWLYYTAWMWQKGEVNKAEVVGNMYRYVAEKAAMKVVHLAIRACGATATMSHYPLERIHRDLTYYVRHENADAIKATVGKAELGLEYDPGFSGQFEHILGLGGRGA